ncbi:MAG: hypothetical protein H7332_07655 [Bdellovibrionales bacterium]|nr:hypothetical protein [Ramlibacter sp.]
MNLIPDWLRRYQPAWLADDLTAGMIVTVMLIAQSLTCALLAGLPPEVGLYASILPIAAYSLFGSGMHGQRRIPNALRLWK